MGIFRFIGGMAVGIALAPVTGGGSLVAVGLTAGTLVEAIGSDDDERKNKESWKKGFEKGYDKGSIDTAKKFAEKLERDNNFRIAAFALGFHISKLAGNPFDKVSVIVGTLGNPNSKFLEPYVRSKNKEIIDSNPSFYQIREKYLSKLSGEDLKLIDEFLEDVVNEGDYVTDCQNFYRNEWKKFLENSASLVPKDTDRQNNPKAEKVFQEAENYYYGFGCKRDKNRAKGLYIEAARLGHIEVKKKFKELGIKDLGDGIYQY